jgi:hypothetical protein
MRLTAQSADRLSHAALTIGMAILILTGNWFLGLTLAIGGVSFIQGCTLDDSETLRLLGGLLVILGIVSLLGVCVPIIALALLAVLFIALIAPNVRIS